METSQILIKPIISEKSLNQAASGWYTFAVKIEATKPEIKKAVQDAFGVKVLDVKTMIIKGKKKRVGRRLRQILSSSWKKATVLLPQDQKIDLFEVPTSAPPAGGATAGKKK